MAMQIHPGRGLGFLALGVSLHAVLCSLKSQPEQYSSIDLHYSHAEPLAHPVIINLPRNGIRLRFDGATQRLRLIEILDFSHTQFTYDGKDVVKVSPDSTPKGPAFRHVYDRLIGPTFPGQYVAPAECDSGQKGCYVLSYPGIAFMFPLEDAAWSRSHDFVHLLSSVHAEPAQSLAIFNGESWQEARQGLYTDPAPIPKSLMSGGRSKATRPEEIDYVSVKGNGVLEVLRRTTNTFRIVLNGTTQQDLLAELGPPDAIYRKSDRRLSIHKTHRRSRSSVSHPKFEDSTDTEYSSRAVTDDSESDDDVQGKRGKPMDTECFWNYFHHGLDVFMSYPQPTPTRISQDSKTIPVISEPDRLVATKVLLHANVPGSYPFNRYRRCRWKLSAHTKPNSDSPALTSETPFSEMSHILQRELSEDASKDGTNHNFLHGMVLNRGWGNSPGSSCELLGGWEGEDKAIHAVPKSEADETPGMGNTELFGFPGYVFEVLKNDVVSCLTVY